MNASIVIAGKAAQRFHDASNVAEAANQGGGRQIEFPGPTRHW